MKAGWKTRIDERRYFEEKREARARGIEQRRVQQENLEYLRRGVAGSSTQGTEIHAMLQRSQS